LIFTVTNQGRANWMIIDGAFNHERLIEFLQALVRDGRRRRKKVFLILDNLGVHHCKPVKAWLTENRQHIEAFVLPSYSPERNPDERLNADLKQAMRAKVPVRTKAKLRAAADEHMQFIAANRDRVRSYFQDPIVKYAAMKTSSCRIQRPSVAGELDSNLGRARQPTNHGHCRDLMSLVA
jgi:transposase